MRVGRAGVSVRAQIRSASGRCSKIIKDREGVEVSVEVPGAGRLILSVNSEGRYTLHASSEGREGPAGTPLIVGKMHAAEYETRFEALGEEGRPIGE